MTGTRGRPPGPVTWSRTGTVVLLLALAAALLAAVLPGGGSGDPAPARTMVVQLPPKAGPSDLDRIAERARRADADLVIVTPPPPPVPYRQGAWTPGPVLSRGIAALLPPTVVDLAGAGDPGTVAGRQPRPVEVVDEDGTVLRAAEPPPDRGDTPTLRVLGLIAVGLLVVPSARALRGIGGLTTPPPQGHRRKETAAPSPAPVQEAAPPTSEPATQAEPPPPPPARPTPVKTPTPPPTFDIHAFRATLAGSPHHPATRPETGPQCPRCGSFDLGTTPAAQLAGSAGACGQCAFGWQLDALGRPPRLLLDPDHFTPRPWGDGGDP
ncbi:hypothetical protein ACK389_25100 [Streptomyces antibioticus]|uniref:hypothetical protein n=1 Tax=Streptomyces antibioticus TaxID=1890 RepID=UPI0033D7DAE6